MTAQKTRQFFKMVEVLNTNGSVNLDLHTFDESCEFFK